MSSPKKIGRWNRFEIAFNEGNWPKPSFGSSAPSRASEKTRTLRKMKKTPGPTTASSEKKPREGNETPGKIPLIGAARPEETLFSESPEEETSREGNETPGKKQLAEGPRSKVTTAPSARPGISSSKEKAALSTFREIAPTGQTVFSRTASANLWTETRRRANRSKRRVELELELERSENSESEKGTFPPRRSRTFRVNEQPRRFDDSNEA